VISTIVNNFLDINKKYVLLAPTGRAAKVINYSNKPAFTIHKKIYFPKKSSGGGVFLLCNKINIKYHLYN
jgi:ATP-dependent exoDNAse (exonuclease V) alpha subunit